jgi:hypothetical protein
VRPMTRASTRAERHVDARHVVTHSYAQKVEFEIKQQPVNKALRISASLRSRVSPAKMSQSAPAKLRLKRKTSEFLRLSRQ